MKSYKAQALFIAILTYIAILVAIFIMILKEPLKVPKAKNYTEKNSDAIEVSLGNPNSSHRVVKKHHKKSSKKHKENKKEKTKAKPKKIRNVKPKDSAKKSSKAKSTKKPSKTKKISKPSKPNTHKLFGAVKDIKANSDNSSDKPKGNNGKSLLKENKMRGEKNAYFAKIQRTLMGWPAQNNFAGEMIVVELKVYPTGLFDYKILSKSLNPEFNIALKNYLEQLRSIGFGSHSNPKPYKIVVKFKAKN